ncbi:hypothetical protein COJ01_12000 [Priestia megaterium]|uniref:hypothetical protein n=1 Tax=Priestia megaterium TaxID=1404 RepID=UPI000BF30EA9|nr:hypothetical protein [Priestia megaterium]PFL01177.1 hypothetical protein COJ01_12000 [Priestia megaterium]
METYEQLHNWLHGFGEGRYISNQLNNIIDPSKQLNYIPYKKSFESEQLDISFIVMNDQNFIEVSFFLHESNSTESNMTFSIRKVNDLLKKDIAYSKMNYPSYKFADLNATLTFRDGHEISLSSEQFKRTPVNFEKFINALLKL